jgi:hypothetical protein
MKLSFLIGGAVGYVLGAKAGRDRYESIVRLARRVGGSQTVQSTAGVLQARVTSVAQKARETVTGHHAAAGSTSTHNGYHR